MDKDAWIAVAADKLRPYEGDNSESYAASLYLTYVQNVAGLWASDPEGAVSEDMGYWEE